jgi:hypothetical protein
MKARNFNMLRNLQTNGSQYANAMCKAKTQMKRGSFVVADEVAKTFDLATGIAGAKIINRGTKITRDVSEGLMISEFDEDQDTILVDEYAYMNELEGRWKTTEYDATTVNTSLPVGSYLSISAGKLVASPSNAVTILKFLGIMEDNGHKMAGFEVDVTSKLA